MKAISKISCHDNLLFEKPLGDWPEYDFQCIELVGQALGAWSLLACWTNLVWHVPGLMHLGSIKPGAKTYYRA